MATILGIISFLLDLLRWVIVIQVILSWLVAFNVINTYNQFVRSVLQALDTITEPIYRPIRRMLPDFGALDLSPLVVLVLIIIIQSYIIPGILSSTVAV